MCAKRRVPMGTVLFGTCQQGRFLLTHFCVSTGTVLFGTSLLVSTEMVLLGASLLIAEYFRRLIVASWHLGQLLPHEAMTADSRR